MNLNNLYEIAKSKLLNGDVSCIDFFLENGYILECSYCLVFKGNLIEAKREITKISDFDFRANWLLKIIEILNNNTTILPSYFQIRNFLEIDLNLLLKAKRPDYIETIINSADLLYDINIETYKFIARVMYNNEYEEVALYFLTKSKSKFYKDPEMHYLLANCYLKFKELKLAEQSLNACLKIIPSYLPAIRLKKHLTNI